VTLVPTIIAVLVATAAAVFAVRALLDTKRTWFTLADTERQLARTDRLLAQSPYATDPGALLCGAREKEQRAVEYERRAWPAKRRPAR
jgi:hypothetical protein